VHTIHDKKNLVNRVRRIQGQLSGIEKLLEAGRDEDYAVILQTVASSRGALNGLMSELIEGHLREHVLLSPNGSLADREKALESILGVLKTYLK
jgi:DNA-binding FrmR family transcriptional regulator